MSTAVDHCTPLPENLTQPGGTAFPDEYLYAITQAITNHPRSLQRSIGPSELGGPCTRRIGYKLLGQPEQEKPPNWLATIGTGAHMWLETAFDGYNLEHANLLDGQERFYIETKVSVGEVNGVEVTGSCDLYDRVTHTVVDHKGLALTTLIPTPTGWTTMGAVRVGDQVFGSDGEPCTVTARSAVKRIGTYDVRFDDGSQIICDQEHIWWTQATGETEPTAKPIEKVINTLTKWGQKSHRVPVAEPLKLPFIDLPIDPYLLGCWLGDGNAADGRITKGTDLFDLLEADGIKLGLEQVDRRTTKCVTRTVIGLTTQLRRYGLLGHKHIPDVYLRASYEQRLYLLQGLMDTDGSWNKPRGRAVFTTTDKALAEQVTELLCTLGQKPNLGSMAAHGFGIDTTAYHVEWTPRNIEPFRLPRKADLVTPRKVPAWATRRMIVAVLPGPDVETACIAVDSPNNVYLCGEQMIPTHNTVGPTRLVKYKRHGPGNQYRIQAHLYGRGWQRAGLPVATVMIAFLPRNSPLSDAYIWSEPYDEQVAIDALQRLAGISLTTDALGDGALALLPTADAYCSSCPFFLAGSDDLARGCPGDPASNVNKPQPANDTEFLKL